MDDLIFLVIVAVIIMAVVFWVRSRQQTDAAVEAGKAQTAQNADQMVQDIKATKTSRVVDAVSILDDLGATQSNYRHYCELIGTSMSSGGVRAPYSQREVAYYSVRCYRIERVNGREYETLVAQEGSVDPFYFTDSSGDQKVYVDLDSFGANTILVNSTNHVEGPNSDFSKAFATQSAGGASGKISNAARACVGLVAGMPAALAGLRARLSPRRTRNGLAYAGVGAGLDVEGFLAAPAARANVAFATPGRPGGGRGPGHMGGGRPPQGRPQRPSGGQSRSRGSSSRNSGMNSPFDPLGSYMGGLGDFLGSGWGSGMPMGGGYNRRNTSSSADMGGMLLGMGLSALLNTLASSSSSPSQTMMGGGQPQDSFRGYRIVEDIVPLGSPIYCIGEIYRHGDLVYMGRSLDDEYSTSYFATKPESEVLATLAR